MTELLVGTKKGLFALAGEPGAPFEVTDRAFAGEPVEYALHDPRSGRLLVSVTSPFYGPKLYYADDPESGLGAGRGRRAPAGRPERARADLGDPARRGGRRRLRGRRPGRAVREPRRRRHVRAQPGAVRAAVAPALGAGRGRPVPALDRHLAGRPGPARRRHLGGRRVAHRGRRRHVAHAATRASTPATSPRTSPRTRSRYACTASSARRRGPSGMFMQFHGGVYRSDDAGASVDRHRPGLPSDFGFPLALDPADPDSAYVIPLTSDLDRVTPDGHVRVYETRDAGASWTPRGDGLPSEDAYLTILREAFASDRRGRVARALLRRDVRRRVRLGGRRRDLVRGRAEPAAGLRRHSAGSQP